MSGIIFSLFFFSTGFAFAHSIEVQPIEGDPGIVARYADGAPAAFVGVNIIEPDSDRVFQEGLTDREGRFVFLPSTHGIWRIHVDDGMGHTAHTEVPVGTISSPSTQPATHLPRGWALVTGVSVIWALFSTYGWWRARRK
jgi:hypothetical protein